MTGRSASSVPLVRRHQMSAAQCFEEWPGRLPQIALLSKLLTTAKLLTIKRGQPAPVQPDLGLLRQCHAHLDAHVPRLRPQLVRPPPMIPCLLHSCMHSMAMMMPCQASSCLRAPFLEQCRDWLGYNLDMVPCSCRLGGGRSGGPSSSSRSNNSSSLRASSRRRSHSSRRFSGSCSSQRSSSSRRRCRGSMRSLARCRLPQACRRPNRSASSPRNVNYLHEFHAWPARNSHSSTSMSCCSSATFRHILGCESATQLLTTVVGFMTCHHDCRPWGALLAPSRRTTTSWAACRSECRRMQPLQRPPRPRCCRPRPPR